MTRRIPPGAGQGELDGMPAPPPSDYETWRDKVWPTYLKVAATRQAFLCWIVARDAKIPDPPNQKRDWARLIGELHRAELIAFAGFGFARDGSAVMEWRGTRKAVRMWAELCAAREGRDAA